MSGKPKISQVTLSTFKSGKCERCGKAAERSKAFTAPTYEQTLWLCRSWEAAPVLHKRCEGLR